VSKALIEKLLRARESGVTVGERTFTIRRPTDAEAVAMTSSTDRDFVRKFVVGWNLTELDIYAGGNADKIEFDAELWSEWVADHPELWTPLAKAILDAYLAHVEARKATEKN